MESNTNTMQAWHTTEIGQGVLQKKYLHPNESFESMIGRVSKVTKVDNMAEYLRNADFFPGGRSIVGAGLQGKQRVSTSNCYVLGTPEDTLTSIYDTCKDAAIIGSLGGGVGVALDNIRPKGALINNSAKISSGVEFVMNLLNETGQNIGQSGRHMAIMVMLDCNHPDITEFLGIKQRNNRLDSMNISIKFTDKFMEAVKADNDYTLSFTVKSTGEVIEKTINAKDFFVKFCECQYDWGDPGGCFVDKVRQYHLLSGYEEYVIDASNPCAEFFGNAGNACLTADSLVRTCDGVRKIGDIVGTAGKVYSINDKFEPYKNVVSKGIKDVYKLRLHNGLTIKATKDHKILTDNGWKEMGDLVVNQDMVKVNKIYNVFAINEFSETHEMYGWMHGDGWFNTTIGISFNYGDGDNDVKERLLPLFKKEFNADDVKPLKDDDVSFQLQLSSSHAMNRCAELGFVACRASEKELPTMFYQWNIKEQLSFIRGLFSADGFITGTTNSQIALASTSYKLVEQVQHYLYSIGMQSRLMSTVFDEKLRRKPQYKLILAGKSAKNYFRIIGFSGSKKNNKFTPGIVDMRKDSFVVREITECSREEVFDIVEVAETNAFYANGMAVHNCNLGSINLYNVITEPFTANARVDFNKLRQLTKDGIVALNNILDYGYSMQPLDYNRDCIDDWRSIGLGIFGMADMFIALGLHYGSDESNEIMEEIMHTMLTTALQESCDLAKEYGVFGKYSWAKTKKSPMLQMLQGTPLYDDIEKHGLRNGTLLSIAPAGTISTMCGISNGCEPLFAVSYERTTHSLEKQGKYFKVYAKSVEDLLKFHGIDNVDTATIKAKFPFVVESHDIPPAERVRTQAILQQYVDNAISSTVNLCETATVQDIFDTYVLAWELGCKGITVFRAGCKRGSILGGKEAVTETPRFNHITPVRRKDLGTTNGKTMVRHTACSSNMYVTVNSQDGNITEVFTNTSQGCQSNVNTLTRMASLALRSGVKVNEVIKELRSNTCAACTVVKSKGNKGVSISCGAAIAEAIEEIHSGTKTSEEYVEVQGNLMECPECHSKTLRPEGKCVTCSNCGFSKCD